MVTSHSGLAKRQASKYALYYSYNVLLSFGIFFFWTKKQSLYLHYTRYQSHKWTVYVRGATNEDLGVIVKRAVFQLHSSFNNPTRVVESPPFELSESGWGEFEVAITLHFHSDVCDKPLNLWVVNNIVCFWLLAGSSFWSHPLILNDFLVRRLPFPNVLDKDYWGSSQINVLTRSINV